MLLTHRWQRFCVLCGNKKNTSMPPDARKREKTGKCPSPRLFRPPPYSKGVPLFLVLAYGSGCPLNGRGIAGAANLHAADCFISLIIRGSASKSNNKIPAEY